MSILVDGLFLVIAGVFVFFSIKSGFVRSILNVAAWFISFLAAAELCSPASAFFYHNFLSRYVTSVIQARLPENMEDISAIYFAGRVTSAVPEFAKRCAESLNVNIDMYASYFKANPSSGSNLAQELSDRLAYPLFTSIISVAMFILIFVVVLSILSLLIRRFGDLIKVSLFKTPDAILGGVFGFVKGALAVLMLSVILHVGAHTLGNEALIKAVDGSYIVSLMKDSHFLLNMFAS
ncbi:MAG: CvpA family protein [Clostridiales bacterium]|nr:CvpA family protein [Clostridiales bacterium]